MRISGLLRVSITLLLSSATWAAPLDSEVPPHSLTQTDFATSTAHGPMVNNPLGLDGADNDDDRTILNATGLCYWLK